MRLNLYHRMGRMQQFLDENTVFPPVNTDFFSSLMARYRHARNRVERVAEIFDSDLSGVIEHFVTGNLESDRVGIIDPVRLFKKERAIKALDASFWDQALRMTDVLDVMPQARRSDWFDQIRSLQTPEFEEESVRSTILSLLQRRHDFLAERIDGIFKGLSSEHVTNKPHAFSRRMIIHYVVCERFGSVESRKAGLITDLRSVISRFMGLNEVEWSSSFSLVAHARKYHGTWFDVDGGALRLRVYKKGTAHLEVHPDMAWRLNAILATILPSFPRNSGGSPRKRPGVRPGGLSSGPCRYQSGSTFLKSDPQSILSTAIGHKWPHSHTLAIALSELRFARSWSGLVGLRIVTVIFTSTTNPST
jgi:hypothetical protein